MHPWVFGSVPVYYLMWGVAAVLGIGGGTVVVGRAGFPLGRSAMALTLCGLAILAGSKLLYVAEALWFPSDSLLPPALQGGFPEWRIPGGILALAAVTAPVCAALRLPWRRFGDALIPVAALMLVVVRLGCFCNGCCFGRRSTLPWAITFPPGSWAFWYHQRRGWIPADAPASLPVHPLQLYFIAAAVLTLLALLWHQRRHSAPGSTQLLFHCLFFGSTVLLEPFREEVLILNQWLCATAAVGAAGVLLAQLHAARATAAPLAKACRS
jgi:prolipoprotein diacylglyceryltransferase